MRILVTGSSGLLGRTLVPRLQKAGHVVIGLDPVPSQTTQVVGSISNPGLVRDTVIGDQIQAIVHAGGLHKPNTKTHSHDDFLAVNVQGTQNLLAAAVERESKVDRFVFTSTTSLMISREIRSGLSRGANKAYWITEELQPLTPRNIYGVTKLSAEHLCRLFHETHGLPLIILRTSRFFPEEDDMAHVIAKSGPNTKINELLFRRLTVEDAAACHIAALDQAPRLNFDTFIATATTPFKESDCEELIVDAPTVVARYFPEYEDIYRRLGWTMFNSIDRIYVSRKMEERLGYQCQTNFRRALDELRIELG